MNRDSILLSIYNNEFRNFQNNQTKSESELEYDLSEIHPINIKEFEDEGYFLIACTQSSLDEIYWAEFEIWKIYKTDKYYHVLEFSNTIWGSFSLPSYINTFTSKYSLYNYYDYDKLDDERQLWRNSTQVIGIKLPDTFKL